MLRVPITIYEQLSYSEKELFHYILDNQKQIVSMTSRELALASNVSKTVVINVAQKLGYDGFNELKFNLKENLNNLETDKHQSFVNTTLKNINDTLILKQNSELSSIIGKIKDAAKIYILAFDPERQLSLYLAQLLSQKMDNINVITRPIDLLDANARDIILFISNSGENNDIQQTLINLADVASIIGIIPFTNNKLATLASDHLYFLANDKDHMPTLTTLLLMIELLASEI